MLSKKGVFSFPSRSLIWANHRQKFAIRRQRYAEGHDRSDHVRADSEHEETRKNQYERDMQATLGFESLEVFSHNFSCGSCAKDGARKHKWVYCPTI
jgi:hypothetical protein